MEKTTPLKPLSKVQLLLIPLVIALFTYICFSPVLKNGFINWDDNGYVFDNGSLRKPLSEAIPYFFGQHYYIGNYVPLTMIVYALEYHAAGSTPYFFHLVNVLFHLVNALLIFWFIYLLSGKKPLVAGLVCFFFALHPMHVESVAWVSELKDVLYTFFFISALIAYYKYGEHGYQKYIFLVATLVLFVLSGLSKPAAVVFPLVLLLIDYYRQRRFDAKVWLEKIPFLLISIILGVIAVKAQQADNLVRHDHTLIQRFFFASHSLLVYLLKCFLPVNLSIFYPYPQLTDGALPIDYYLSPLALAALLYGFYRLLKQSRVAIFGALFFLVNIVLVLQLIAVGDAAMAERYTYVSYTGLFFALAMGFHRLYTTADASRKTLRRVAMGAVFAASIACVYATHARCKVWRNDNTIATDLLNKFPDDRFALNNKGFILMEQRRYAEAVPLFTRAIQLKPDYIMAYVNLTNSYLSLSDYKNALAAVDTALSRKPADDNLLHKKAQVLFLGGDYKVAADIHKKFLAMNKDNIGAYGALTECYYKMKDYPGALRIADEALKRVPNNYMLLNNKGYMLFAMERYSEAIPFFEASLKINPEYKAASANLADCQRAMNDPAKVKR